MSRPNFENLNVGDALTGITVRVLRVEPKEKRGSGESYARLLVTDGRKDIYALFWGISAKAICELSLEVGKCPFIVCDAKVAEFNGEQNIHITSVDTLDQAPADASDYFRKSPYPLDQMLAELDARIARIQQPDLAELVQHIIGQSGLYREEFTVAPAAKAMHHAYVHGLLEHSLDVAYNVEQDIFRHTQLGLPLFADLLRAGALLHDIGKLQELEYRHGTYDYTSEGNDLGHSAIGMMLVNREAIWVDTPPELLQKLLHLIASHHGKVEWGAVIEPKTLEAHLLHLADYKSASVFYYHEAIANAKEGAEYIHKTKLDDRTIFLGMKRVMAESGVE